MLWTWLKRSNFIFSLDCLLFISSILDDFDPMFIYVASQRWEQPKNVQYWYFISSDLFKRHRNHFWVIYFSVFSTTSFGSCPVHVRYRTEMSNLNYLLKDLTMVYLIWTISVQSVLYMYMINCKKETNRVKKCLEVPLDGALWQKS